VADRMSSRKVLAAVRPADLDAVSTILLSRFDVIICHTLEDVLPHLGENIGVIVCGVRFDSGRMFDLLHAVRSDPHARTIPFYLIMATGKSYSKSILNGIKTAATVLGANGFTDLSELENDLGKATAHETLREVIRQHLQS
jgi:hypothetical protein